jgi:2-polyprenyl-3-methyl-5-hydroxy-6-metoxy-1,4-benzoquinol methylase
MNCKVCDKEIISSPVVLHEMMFNTGELFTYYHCESCNSLQIENIPKDLTKYYTDNYYSFQIPQSLAFRKAIKYKVIRVLSAIKGDFFSHPFFLKYGLTYNDRNKKILDVGCGQGKLLFELEKYGFMNLNGLDPYINMDYSRGKVKIHKKEINELHGSYDIIMSHHSMEHFSNPNMLFGSVKRLLKADGQFILRIPIFPNYIWEKYKTYWIQLDPPRHLFIFSVEAIELLCNKIGLEIISVSYDSEPWSLASTEYCLSGKSHIEFENNISISDEQNALCFKANQDKVGDQVCIRIRQMP